MCAHKQATFQGFFSCVVPCLNLPANMWGNQTKWFTTFASQFPWYFFFEKEGKDWIPACIAFGIRVEFFTILKCMCFVWVCFFYSVSVCVCVTFVTLSEAERPVVGLWLGELAFLWPCVWLIRVPLMFWHRDDGAVLRAVLVMYEFSHNSMAITLWERFPLCGFCVFLAQLVDWVTTSSGSHSDLSYGGCRHTHWESPFRSISCPSASPCLPVFALCQQYHILIISVSPLPALTQIPPFGKKISTFIPQTVAVPSFCLIAATCIHLDCTSHMASHVRSLLLIVSCVSGIAILG